jgi:transcription initiation factor TFIID subunit 2
MPGVVAEAELALPQDPEVTPAPEPPIDDTPARPYTVFHEQVSLDIDLREKSISGHVDIFISCKEQVPEVFIDARQCDIDVSNIKVSGCPTKATYDDPYAFVDTPESYRWSASQWAVRKQRMRPLLYRRRKEELTAVEHEEHFKCHPVDESLKVEIPPIKDLQASIARQRELGTYGQRQQVRDQWNKAVEDNNGSLLHKITIPFVLKNIRDGLHFVGIDEADSRYPHVYTQHSIEPGTACSIFPCIDDPGCRSSWSVSLTFPRTLGDAFHQSPVTQPQQVTNGVTAVESRKRKHGDDEPRRPNLALTEEDKLLELTVVCSGKLEDEAIDRDDETKKTMTFTCGNKAARHIGFALGPFEHVDLWSEFRTEEDDEKLGSLATKVHGYCLPGRAEEVKNTCATIVTAMDHFAMTYGRYPFDNYKVCFVDDMVADTVSLCGFSLCTNRILFPREVIDNEYDVFRTLVHSLATQWCGINIIPNAKSDIWLVTGIAWFMTDIFMKNLSGNNEYRFRMKALTDRLVEVDMNRPSLHSLGEHLHLGDFEIDFMNLKSALVLFILDRRLSKSSGSAGIARIIAKMVSKANTSGTASDEILTSDMFRRACEKHGQTRLESFWNQWVVGSGCPRFDVYQRFNKKRLCVEMTIRQGQDMAAAKSRPLDKDAFWKDVMEENHAVYAGELQHCFTGPMTIRIHEADGTPYEHIVEIREDSAKTVKFEIPYNTKYKRLKRNRRQRERQIAGTAAKPNEDAQEESLLYCLGDVLQTQEDIEQWGFIDWEEDIEARMDQESYEWIRMDADFEWICSMKTNMPAYMYVSQLQQDRDVVAQQESILYLANESIKSPHPLISTILTRTLVDTRYFHGLRTMAAEILPRHAVDEGLHRIGLKHLLKTFQQLFCYGGDYEPRPNDFSDKSQYIIQCAIPEAIAQVRDKDGTCPKEARRFILQQLQCNDNAENCYSDQSYICRLIAALATCQVPNEKNAKKKPISFSFGDADDDDEPAVDPEPQQFRDLALEEIERYRRMDEYSPSFKNCFTVAALDAQCRLMKAKVIPYDPVVFIRYLQDKTVDVVRIKAFEAMVELGSMSQPVFLKFFMSVVTTDSSPFVRDRLFKIFCRGLASIAIGENLDAEKDAPIPNESGLIVEQESSVIEAKQKEKARRENLTNALAALKDVTKDDENWQTTVWNAFDSPSLTVAERRNLLELCSILFEDDERLVVTYKYPNFWTVSREPKERGRVSKYKSREPWPAANRLQIMMHFKRQTRTKSRKTYSAQPVVPARPEPKRTITLNLNRAPSMSVAKVASPTVAPPPPPPLATKPTVTVTVPKPATPRSASPPVPAKEVRRDSIAVQTPRPSIEATTPSSERKALPGASTKPSTAPKPQAPKIQPPKPQAPKIQAPKIQTPKIQTPKIQVSKPQPPKVQATVQAASKAPAIPAAPAKSPGPPKTTGAVRSGSLAPQAPKSLKRQSTEPSEGQRPSKIVKLNTKNIPASAFQKRARIVTLPFTQWTKLQSKDQASATPEAGSIRATPKGPRPPKERSNSIIIGSPMLSQSPQQSTPTTAGNTSFSSPPLPTTQTSSTPPSQSQGSTIDGIAKPVRKPLPSGDRKPLPSGGRTSLPSAIPHSTPSHPPPSSASASAAPPKTKFKIKVKPATQ